MIVNARKLQYRRLHRANSQIDNTRHLEKSGQDKITNLMDIMIKHIKSLLTAIFQFRKTIKQNYGRKSLFDRTDRLQNFYKLVKVDPEVEISQLQISIEVSYFRMFYFRLVKEISYYLSSLKISHALLENIEDIIENQLEKHNHPIIFIFQFTRNKLILELERLNKVFTQICKAEENKQEQSEDSVKKRIKLSIRKKQSLTIEFTEFLRKFQNTFYSCLKLQCIEIINLYLPSVSINANIDLIARKQLKRNKKIKKEIKTYKIEYENYKQKKNKTRSKPKTRKLSVSKLRQKTQIIDTSNILFPIIKNQKDTILRDFSNESEPNKVSRNLSTFQKQSKIQNRENQTLARQFCHMIGKEFHRQNFRLKLQALDNYKKSVQ